MKDSDVHVVLRALEQFSKTREISSDSPFLVLISCLLSLRTKDAVTEAASRRLFALARTPQQMLNLSLPKIRKLIYPAGFYRVKAQRIHQICHHLIGRFRGRVPETLEDLLTLPGVGRKTANLVMTLGHKKPGICVDVHVHRISNRLGYVKTRTPFDTEMALRKKLPRRYWMEYNALLVSFGQELCRPVSPWCSCCPVSGYCAKVGVTTHR